MWDPASRRARVVETANLLAWALRRERPDHPVVIRRPRPDHSELLEVAAPWQLRWLVCPSYSVKERLAPILMTALATGLALVPLAVAGSIPGHEIEHPMAIVILGGLITSTLLNLFVLPSLYLRFGKSRRALRQ